VKIIQQLDHDYYHPGLARLVIYTFNESEAFTTPPASRRNSPPASNPPASELTGECLAASTG